MKYALLLTFIFNFNFSYCQDNLTKLRTAKNLFSNGQITSAIQIFEEVYESKKHPDVAFFLAYSYAKINDRKKSSNYIRAVQLNYHDLNPLYHNTYQIIDLWTRYPYAYVKYGIVLRGTLNNYSDSDLFLLFSSIGLPITNEKEIITK